MKQGKEGGAPSEAGPHSLQGIAVSGNGVHTREASSPKHASSVMTNARFTTAINDAGARATSDSGQDTMGNISRASAGQNVKSTATSHDKYSSQNRNHKSYAM